MFHASFSKKAQTLLLQIVKSWERQGWENRAGFRIARWEVAEMDELIDGGILKRCEGNPIRCTLTETGRNLIRPVRNELLRLAEIELGSAAV